MVSFNWPTPGDNYFEKLKNLVFICTYIVTKIIESLSHSSILAYFAWYNIKHSIGKIYYLLSPLVFWITIDKSQTRMLQKPQLQGPYASDELKI